MLPLKPDPAAARDLAVKSLVRAAIATGLATLDRGTTTARHAAKVWQEDDGVSTILRAADAREDHPALVAVSTAFLAALVPMSLKIVTTTKGRLTPLQRAYCLGYRRCLLRMRRELKDIVANELAEMKGVVDGIERDYANAKAVAAAMAERDPEVRLH